MTDALTATPWLAVLNRIIKSSDNDTTRTLAKMLYEIFNETTDPRVGEIADAYAYNLLRGLSS